MEIDRYEAMTYRRCARSGLKLPLISFGLWHNFGEDGSPEVGRDMIRHAFDAGITHFDLANNCGPPPGAAEEFFGRILRTDLRDHRDELVVTARDVAPVRSACERRSPAFSGSVNREFRISSSTDACGMTASM